MDPIDVDGVFEDSILHHMDWRDTVHYGSARQDCAPTVGSVPETMLMAVADARTAVLVRAQTATGIERNRLLKLLFFLDQKGQKVNTQAWTELYLHVCIAFGVAVGTVCGEKLMLSAGPPLLGNRARARRLEVQLGCDGLRNYSWQEKRVEQRAV